MKKLSLLSIVIISSTIYSAPTLANIKSSIGVESESNFTGWNINYRGMFTPNLGVKVAYHHSSDLLRHATVSGADGVRITNLESRGPSASLIGQYPLNEGFSLYGTAGLTYFEVENGFVATDSLGQQINLNVKDRKVGSTFAAGVEWKYQSVSLNLGYDYNKSDLFSTSGFVLGANMHF